MNERVARLQFYTRIIGIVGATLLTYLSDYKQDLHWLYIIAIIYLIFSYCQYKQFGIFKNEKVREYSSLLDIIIVSAGIAYRGGLRSDYYLGYFVVLSYGMYIRGDRFLLKLLIVIVASYSIVSIFFTDPALYSISRLFIRLSMILGTVCILYLNNRFLFMIDDQRRIAVETASKDKLTGAYNRRVFDVIEDGEIKRGYTHLAMLDIDDFKEVNDNYGHDKGDEVLIVFSEIIKNHLDKNDWFIRYGGEEFLIVVKEDSRFTVEEMLKRIKDDFSKYKFDWSESETKITFTAGISEILNRDIKTVIKDADQKLYYGKSMGKDCVIM